MRFLRIERADLPRWHAQLEKLEQRSVYPLGNDAFRISHGADYFAFFERLGVVRYYAWEDEGELVAVGCGTLRRAPRAWYMADLKVHPAYRDRHLPIGMLRRAFFQNWLRCGVGYGVAMNPPDGRVPPAVRLLAHFKWIPSSMIATTQLDIYSADFDGMRKALPIVKVGRPHAPHLTSLAGKKDLILESTKQPLALLHLRYGDLIDERTFREPQRGNTHMWCVPRESAWTAPLQQAGFAPAASATIVHHRMRGMDWSMLDTSEI